MFPYAGGVPSFFPAGGARRRWLVREAAPGVWLSGPHILVRARFPLLPRTPSSDPDSPRLSDPEAVLHSWYSDRAWTAARPRSPRGVRRRSDSGGRGMWLGRHRLAPAPLSSSLPSPLQSPLHSLWDASVASVLRGVDSWDFDVFHLERVTCGKPVVSLGLELFRRHGLLAYFHLEPLAVMEFLREVEESYAANPYHNSIHAADVGQSMHCLLLERSVGERLSPLETLACILAAFAHDIFHPGLNQAFLSRTEHFLAALYRHSSVLEHFHYHCLLSILARTRLLHSLTPQDQKDLKNMLELMVLATDMQQQKKYIDQFQVFLRSPDSPHIRGDAAANCELMQILIKCADINNPCRRWALSRQWSLRATHEFFAQGDEERRRSLLPISPACDRALHTVPQIQIYFMEKVAKQLFVDWDRFLGSRLTRTMMENLEDNCRRWQEEDARVVSEVELRMKEDSPVPALLLPPAKDRRRVSTSVLYQPRAQRKFSGKWSRRVSMPATVASTTTWTIWTPLRTMRTTSRETVATDDSIVLQPPLQDFLSPLADVAESPGTPQDSPRRAPDSPPPDSPPYDSPPPDSRGPGARRRFSEPAVVCASDSLALAAALWGQAEASGAGRGRRGSLPLHLHTPSPHLSNSSGSQSLQIVGAF